MEYVMIIIGGLLGSSHCVGMCGGFVLSIGAGSSSVSQNLTRQLIYSFGRITTYMFLGAVVGFAGTKLKDYASDMINVSALLSVIAGVLLVIQGIHGLGFSPWKTAMQQNQPCLMGGLLKSYLLSPKSADMVAAGILTGFLPCGLVYAFLALASASGHVLQGALIMGLFGLGTVPLLLATGVSLSAISPIRRKQLLQLASLLVFATGVLTVSRGIAFATAEIESSPVPCPFCETTDLESGALGSSDGITLRSHE